MTKFLDGLFRVGLYSLALLVLFGRDVSWSAAQQGFFWSSQQRIPDYYDSTEEPPYLISDSNRVVHAFNSQPLNLENQDSLRAIYYRQWTVENGWTSPNDIIYDENFGNISLVGVTYDVYGIVHIAFLSGDLSLYYTYAYLSKAGLPQAWAKPQLIAGGATRASAGIENVAAIAIDAEAKNLAVIYSGSQYGSGLYYVFSTNSGTSWSAPYLIHLVEGSDVVVTDPKLYVGESGIFHAVWSHFKMDGSGGSGYYASWDQKQQTWNDPLELDVPGIRTPSVIEYGGNVFVSYHHVSSNGNWWRRSADLGMTWTAPVRVSSRHVGTNGALSFVVDGSNTLHAFFGERINDANHGLWHIIWIGNSWSNPEPVVRGPQIRDVMGGAGFDPRSARAVVSNGNMVLVAWGTDGYAGVNGAWYSYKRLDIPELSQEILPTPIITTESAPLAQTPEALPTIKVVSEPTRILSGDALDAQTSRGPQFAILVGVVPVILLLAGIIIVRYLFYTKNT